jgi:hypothetical protein|tara:strand:- start:292 stop:477 length:186 start_codon:yes stop_codon:yes gene_type:complete
MKITVYFTWKQQSFPMTHTHQLLAYKNICLKPSPQHLSLLADFRMIAFVEHNQLYCQGGYK